MPFVLEKTVARFLRVLVPLSLFLLLSLVCHGANAPDSEALSLLRDIIAEHNLNLIKKSLEEGTYRGEAGILRIRPEVAQEFGLRVQLTDQYRRAKEMLEDADGLYEDVIEALKRERSQGLEEDDIETIIYLVLSYKDKKKQALEGFKDYYDELHPDKDQRLDRNICGGLLERELATSFARYRYRLRDGLADFYNRSYMGSQIDPPLSPDNAPFVNEVFNRFVQMAPKRVLACFDLDSCAHKKGPFNRGAWKKVLSGREREYAAVVERLFQRSRGRHYRVDPLLFMALIKRESNFDPIAVSQVGAAGITQIMPQTAKQLGMKSIFVPSYLQEARELLRREREWKSRALALIEAVENQGMGDNVLRAWVCMQRAIRFAKRRKELFSRYAEQLVKEGWDDRLDATEAIRHGYRYLTDMLNKYKGDISLALAAYNAGPNRVRKYQGIPPFPETVTFRNMVLRYYDEYMTRLKGRGCR